MLSIVLALTATLSIEDYATMPTLSGPQFSPDGKRIAYVVTRADMQRSAYDADVWLVDSDGARNVQLTAAEGNDTAPRWSPDGKRLAFLSERDGRSAIWIIAPDGGEATKLTSEATSIRDFAWSPDGKSIAFLRLDAVSADDEKRARERDDAKVVGAGDRFVHLHLLDVETKVARRLTTGDFSIFTFDWSPDGSTIAIDRGPSGGLDGMYRTDLWMVAVKDGALTPLVVRPGLDRFPVFSPDGKRIAFVSGGGVADWHREHRIHIIERSGGTPRLADVTYGRTPESLAWIRDEKGSDALLFEGPWNTTSRLLRLGSDGALTTISKEGMVQDPDVDAARGRVAYIGQSLNAPPELYVADLAGFAPRKLTKHNDAIRERSLAPTRIIRWKNPQDGLEIEGLLTLPAGHRAGTRVPLLVFVHGGPASRFDEGFLGYLGPIYSIQALAAKGFAVLRPNPRGTGGYGESFRQANRNDWGGMDWLDINAGIDQLIADGIADRDRLGLMGWSYGGFMASWALSHSDRFKAVSIGAPVVDLLSFHGTTDIRDFIPSYFAGMPLDLLRARSPLWQLDKSTVPVLIQHGDADDRVPLSQGTMLYRRLQELGTDVTMVIYPRAGHVPREPKLRIDVARRNVEFFTRYLSPDHP